MARHMLRLARGVFRVVLGLVACWCVVYAVLWLLERAQRQGLLGGAEGAAAMMWPGVIVALALGIASAVVIDRLWLKLRRVGPKLMNEP